ncbi:MAG: glucuronate isomerase [Phycisphaera sp.]|nr:glucuronate isomerase [Phycisphaera sp.]
MTMNSREDWRQAVLEIPVFDTHTHMNNPGVPIAAQNVWDILHYFWFQQELWSVGYPKDPMALPEGERIDRFIDAFHKVRNTVWALIVRETFRRLYGVELHDAGSIRVADEAVRANATDAHWPRGVMDRLNIKRITVNSEKGADFPGLPGVGVALPLWPGYKHWAQQILDAKDQREVSEQARAAAMSDVADIASRGHRGMRIQSDAFDGQDQEAIVNAVAQDGPLRSSGNSTIGVHAFLTHTLLHALSEHRLFAQLFLGINRLPGTANLMAVNDPRRIVNLYALFERYPCGFELVAGAPQMNMDIAQAARIYPNVYCGGLWWYNFRSSTYRQAMQARLEAVPACKSVLLASDGRCIEWCFAKTLLVKWLLADFLHGHVRDGWINERDALWVANEWLHDAAARRYV